MNGFKAFTGPHLAPGPRTVCSGIPRGMLWGSKCAHTSVYVRVLGMMVLSEILSCLEFDKHQNREKNRKSQNNGGERRALSMPWYKQALGKCLSFLTQNPCPQAQWASWLGRFGQLKAKVGLPTGNHLAALGLLGEA